MNVKEFKTKSVDELKTELNELLREQFNLRMQKGMDQTGAVRPHAFKQVRRNIARVKTLLREKAD